MGVNQYRRTPSTAVAAAEQDLWIHFDADGNQSRRQDAVHFNKRRAREFFKNGYQGFQWPSRSTPA